MSLHFPYSPYFPSPSHLFPFPNLLPTLNNSLFFSPNFPLFYFQYRSRYTLPHFPVIPFSLIFHFFVLTPVLVTLPQPVLSSFSPSPRYLSTSDLVLPPPPLQCFPIYFSPFPTTLVCESWRFRTSENGGKTGKKKRCPPANATTAPSPLPRSRTHTLSASSREEGSMGQRKSNHPHSLGMEAAIFHILPTASSRGIVAPMAVGGAACLLLLL